LGVCHGDVLPNGSLERMDTRVDSAAELAFGEQREPALHESQPRRTGWGEVQVEPRPFQKPPADQGRLMGAIVVQDHMHVQVGWDMGLDRIKELPELARPMPLMEGTDDAARLHVQGREQRGRAMAAVVMRPALHLPGAHRQQEARAVQRLNLRCFIHAQDECFVRRMEVESHNIAHLLDEQRIGRQFEGFRPMRLQTKGAPDAMHGTAAHPAPLRHGARAPLRRLRGRRLQGLGDNPFHSRIGHRPRRAGAGLIQQPIQAVAHKALPPLPDGLHCHPEPMGDGGVRVSLRTRKHDPGSLGQGLRRLRTPRPLLQALSFHRRHGQPRCRSSSSHGVLPSMPENTSAAQLIPCTSETGH